MSFFLNLSQFAAKIEVTRQTAQKYLESYDYAHLRRGKSYSIPACAIQAKAIKNFLYEKKEVNDLATTFMLVNNKGGTGKTTSSINIAASLAFYGYKVLLVDNDIQSNTSSIASMDMENDFTKHNLTKLLLEIDIFSNDKELKKELKKTIFRVKDPVFKNGRLDLLPNSLEYDEMHEQLFFKPNPENMLDRLLAPIKHKYDFIIIDSSPTLDVSWRMGVMASDSLIISVKPEKYSMDGISGIFKRIYSLNNAYYDRKKRNISVLGAVVTDYDNRKSIAKISVPILQETLDEFSRYNQSLAFEPYISSSVDAANAQVLNGAVILDNPTSRMSSQYLELTNQIIYRQIQLQSKEEEGENNE